MRVRGCEECERLWEDFSNSVFEHVRLDGQMKMVGLRDQAEAAKLKIVVDVSARRRDVAHIKMKQHEETHVQLAAAV